MNGEFGGIQRIGDRYYITMSEGRVGVGKSPQGPFRRQEKNHNVFGGNIYFPRFFHTAPDGPLMNHFYKDGPVYAAPLKAIDVDHEGVLRLIWWPGNEKLKAAGIPVRILSSDGPIRWLKGVDDVNQTVIIEGTARLPEAGRAGPALRGLVIDRGDGTAECLSFDRTQTLMGEVRLDAQPMKMTVRQRASRDLDFGRDQRFRVLLNRDMMEVYVNEYLTILARVKNTGRLGLLTGEEPRVIDNVRVWRSATENEAPQPAVKKP